MFGYNPRMQRAGSPISARAINSPSKQAQQSARLSVGPGLAMTHIAGIPLIRRDRYGELTVKITAVGTGGKYGWKQVVPDPDHPGGWIDGSDRLVGTLDDDPLYEFNGNDQLTADTVLPAFRSEAGAIVAQMDVCTTS